MGKTPRPHQTRAVEMSRAEYRKGRRRGVVVMPTGGGKTVFGWMAVEPAVALGRRVVFLADRRVLVTQAAASARDFGLPAGIVMSDAPFGWRDRDAPVQVVSKDTAVAWLKASERGERRPDLPPADFIVTDECHRSSGESWEFLRAAYPGAWELGLTATPMFPNGRGLGERYEFMVNPVSYAELIAARVLVAPECYAPDSKVRGKAGVKPTRAGMVGDAVKWWKVFADGLRTFCFASGVGHSMALRDEFRRAGIPAEHLDGNTPNDERAAILGGPDGPGLLARRETLVVCNCNVARYGVDVPEAECCQIVTPMTSGVDFRQAVGRVMRDDPGNPGKRAVVIDHAGAVLYHGLPHADLPWTLDGDTDHVEVQRKRMESGEAPKPVACPQCHTLFSGSRKCPGCGWEPQRRAAPQATKAGTLQRVEDGTVRPLAPDELRRKWRGCLGVAANQGRTIREAAGMFLRQTGRRLSECGRELPDFPGPGDWGRPVKDVFPGYARRRDDAA